MSYARRLLDLVADGALFGEFLAALAAGELALLGPYGPVYGTREFHASLMWPPVLCAAGICLVMLLLRAIITRIPGGEDSAEEPDHRPLNVVTRTLYEFTEGASAMFGLAFCSVAVIGPGMLDLIGPHMTPFYVLASASIASMIVFALSSLGARIGQDDDETPTQLGER
jgi:hypothetical protein